MISFLSSSICLVVFLLFVLFGSIFVSFMCVSVSSSRFLFVWFCFCHFPRVVCHFFFFNTPSILLFFLISISTLFFCCSVFFPLALFFLYIHHFCWFFCFFASFFSWNSALVLFFVSGFLSAFSLLVWFRSWVLLFACWTSCYLLYSVLFLFLFCVCLFPSFCLFDFTF